MDSYSVRGFNSEVESHWSEYDSMYDSMHDGMSLIVR